ncbi:DinB family protein [Sinomicrobium weinanense]|uniref:DinB family protein n=1 Tax=Sinomicrobium weinanense TaxID=2842200 RepID=A0A926JPL9_9FLAO|nr:DinB family protein [Sinomicrobium weinanense]MBC9795155.1 DinB family protein [Sinomicrobium weinanense]
MKNTLTTQYDLIKQSREVLFQYCDTISREDFTRENSSFGRGSIRNLLVHTGNTYELWIGQRALHKSTEFTRFSSITTTSELRIFYGDIDTLMKEFFSRYASGFTAKIPLRVNNRERNISPLQLFTHVITHEFHHKGQILSLSRHLGYIPVDTDVIR